jgi:hypothetical protein
VNNIFLTIYFLTAGHTLLFPYFNAKVNTMECCTSSANESDCDNKENEVFHPWEHIKPSPEK